MSLPRRDLDADVERALADPTQADNPLRPLLDELWQSRRYLLQRLDRIAHLSDSYQAMARRKHLDHSQQVEKQLRQLEKVTRISDRYQAMLHDLNLALSHASTHDVLTGLANRRLLSERLRHESERCDRHESGYCLALVDIDRFKRVNDVYGHDIGDRVLVALARALQSALRDYDLCGRWGGEEFLILLPNTRLDQAVGAAERIRAAAHALEFADLNPPLQLSVSIGIGEYHAGEGADACIKRADQALLEAKREGRDRARVG